MTTTKLLWFVLAGFLLGFTVSTLWEWFHFRRERLKLTDRRIRELEEQLRERDEEIAVGSVGESEPDADEEAWTDPAYRSPGVFLETESLPPESASEPPTAPVRAPSAAPVPAAKPEPKRTRVTALTDDPARARRAEALAALRRTSEAMQRSADAKPEPRQESSAPAAPSFVPPAETPAETPTETPAGTAAADKPEWANDPELTRRATNHPDDLSKIRGIGDVYKQRLYRAGVYTWHQIAEADIDTLRRATSAYPSSNVEEWPEQARALAEKAGRSDAIYEGQPPDDFTKIHGIGPVGLQSLYRAGICTFEQLAVTPVDELAALFPIAVAGDQPDFDQWIAQATRLADAKHES